MFVFFVSALNDDNCKLYQYRISDLVKIRECFSGQLVQLLGICLHIVEQRWVVSESKSIIIMTLLDYSVNLKLPDSVLSI